VIIIGNEGKNDDEDDPDTSGNGGGSEHAKQRGLVDAIESSYLEGAISLVISLLGYANACRP
jgi:hypothetical protein